MSQTNGWESMQAASVVFAAGKGSRMHGFEGNKTLLPLVPGASLYEGERPMLLEVLSNLPPGPKGIVVHHRADDVQSATEGLGVQYIFQPETNGTGGALLAAGPFLESVEDDNVIVTMGDVPLIRRSTYSQLIAQLKDHAFVLLAFEPVDRAQYGMIEMDEGEILRIVEWKYWSLYDASRQKQLRYCNAGVYAARRPVLLHTLELLARNPHAVRKQRGDAWVTIQEYFLTDLVEMMHADGLRTAMVEAPEEEVMGVDTPEMLSTVQRIYRGRG
ncbi:MAG: NTP transferase domain-containing protein [Syntrophobacteraceae bacterium]|nr:NTP transferase domain-containing protein [Syntrophobacteraceae bacterium]